MFFPVSEPPPVTDPRAKTDKVRKAAPSVCRCLLHARPKCSTQQDQAAAEMQMNTDPVWLERDRELERDSGAKRRAVGKAPVRGGLPCANLYPQLLGYSRRSDFMDGPVGKERARAGSTTMGTADVGGTT